MESNLNLFLAWLWILLGFVTGLVLGLFFHGENWLGGYGSFKRRLYRLGHISFFGLGTVNLLFWLTRQKIFLSEPLAEVASWMFIIGAVTMPLCCVIMAHFPKAHLVFAVPVLSLIAGGVLTLILICAAADLPPPTLHTSSVKGRRNCRRLLDGANPLALLSSLPVNPKRQGTATHQDAVAPEAPRFTLNFQSSTLNPL